MKTQNTIKTNISYQTVWDVTGVSKNRDVTETNFHNINKEMSETNSLFHYLKKLGKQKQK